MGPWIAAKLKLGEPFVLRLSGQSFPILWSIIGSALFVATVHLAEHELRGTTMTWRDKLEIGLKEDAPFRKDNLPESQVRGPEIPKGPGRSPEIPMARDDRNEVQDTDAPGDASVPTPTTQTDVEAEEDSEAAATTDGMPPAALDENDALGG